METLRIISLVLSIISGFSLSFIGGYLFGKYKEEKLMQTSNIKNMERYKNFTFLDKPTPFCETPLFDEKYECIQIHDSTELKSKIVGFCGVCKVKNGDVASLDGDSYYKEMTVIAYDEFLSKENKLCLDILVEDW